MGPSATVTSPSSPERKGRGPVCRIYVTLGLLDTLGAAPLRGRLLGSADFAADGAPAALVTDGLWRSHFASTPTITGAAIRLDEQPFTIVGVVPASVFGQLQQREGLLDAGRFDRCVVTPIVRGRNGEDEMILTYMRTQRDGAVVRAVGATPRRSDDGLGDCRLERAGEPDPATEPVHQREARPQASGARQVADR